MEHSKTQADVGPAAGEDDAQPSDLAGPDASPDQWAAHVSRTTLAGMQRLWRSHAAAMDVQGRSFAQTCFTLHSQALQEVAAMKTFEPKQVTAVLNTFTAGIREEVLRIFQVMRQADDGFAQGLYQLSRKAFTRNLREALEAKDIACADKIRRLKAEHEEALAQQRMAAAVALQQDAQLIRRDVDRELRDENRQKLAEAIRGITTELNRQYAAHVEALNKQYSVMSPRSRMQMVTTPPSPGPDGSHPSSPVRPLTGRTTLSTPPTEGGSVQQAPFNIFASIAPGTEGSGSGGGGGGGGGSVSLELIQALIRQDDDHIGSLMARKEVDGALKAADQAVEDLRVKVEELQHQLQQEKVEIEAWKEKWTQESHKTDGIKRECMQIIVKCEKRVKVIQQEHNEEMSKRDTVIQRSKDTILRLESKISQLTGQPADPRLVPLDTSPRGDTTHATLPAPVLVPPPAAPLLQPALGAASRGPTTAPQLPQPPVTALQVEATLAELPHSLGEPSPLPPVPAAPGGSFSMPASPAIILHQHSIPSPVPS